MLCMLPADTADSAVQWRRVWTRMQRLGAVLSSQLLMVVAACSGIGRTSERSPTPAGHTSLAISAGDARHRLFAIADDSMGGRPTGSAGHVKLTEYLASEMRRLGLAPGGDSGTYFQRIPLVKWRLASGSVSTGETSLTLWKDFVPFHPGGPTRRFDGAQVVFGGILQDTMRQITREQAEGKFVILLNSDANPGANMRTAPAGSRLETAAAVATVNSARGMEIWRQVVRNPDPQFVDSVGPGPAQPATLSIGPDVAEILLATTLDTLLAVGTRGIVVSGGIEFQAEPVVARNVVAILRGSDAARRSAYVAVGAHSDHIPFRATPVDHDSLRAWNMQARHRSIAAGGRSLTRAERGEIRPNVDSLRAIRPARADSINNGADDDGSGIVTLLEVSEALAGMSNRPARSVIFVWHAAEELGLFGSRYFTDHPSVPLDSLVAELNFDMVGRGGTGDVGGGGPKYLQVIGWRRLSSELGSIIVEANNAQPVPFVFDLQYDQPGHPQGYYCRSDHYMYARHGIPVAFFTTGDHADYHQVTDEPQYIDYDKLASVARLAQDIVLRLADLDHRPVVDGRRPGVAEPCVQ